MARAVELQSVDRALLATLANSRSLVEASRRTGISRDRAVYRVRRLERGFRRRIVRARRGGPGHGRSELTPFGRSLARSALGPPPTNHLAGIYDGDSPPGLRVFQGPRLSVAFRAKPGERLSVTISPDAILLARGRFRSSARNVLPGRVTGRLRVRRGTPLLPLDCEGSRLHAAVTPESVRRLGLLPGRRIFVYLKATAIRPDRGWTASAG